eukprot:m.411659 g.411659  ORF g.411659 m.411659 type:complete len:537 (-) comp20165_c0_seq8:2243-3853(-)
MPAALATTAVQSRLKAPDDLTQLPSLDNTSLLSALKQRYMRDVIYTFAGDVLVAVNPHKPLPALYDSAIAKAFQQGAGAAGARPHVFAVAAATCNSARQSKRSQVCVVSGESGAGKTESTKYLLQQTLAMCVVVDDDLHHKIIQLNPVLEAFGNASTIMNHNSSRFGKFLELTTDDQGRIAGGQLSTYLLEKSRVVRLGSAERNFHVFYYLVSGAPADLRDSFKLPAPHAFAYLRSDAPPLDPSECTAMWTELMQALEAVGLAEWMDDIVSVLAAVLHIGNLGFDQGDDECSFFENLDDVEIAAAALMVPKLELQMALTEKTTTIKGETFRKGYTSTQALDCRDGGAKAMYGQLFEWLVTGLNRNLRASVPTKGNLVYSFLDIFGFEDFAHNSFEQLCINLANEQLQFYFNKHLFALELQEYEREEVKGVSLTYTSNQPLLDLFLAKPIGLMSLLDEESGLASGTENGLLRKLDQNLSHDGFECKAAAFVIAHYAGTVTYSTDSILEKNRDPVPDARRMLWSKQKPTYSHALQRQA